MSPHVTALTPADRVVAFLDLVKSLRWPAVAVLVLLLLQVPLHGVLASFPGMDAASRTMMAGHLPIRVDEQGLPAANDEVVHAVRSMDGDLLRIFLDMDQTAVYCGSLDAEYRAGLRRLAHINLVEARYEPQRGGECAQNTVMTEQGKRVQTYLISLMVSLLKG